MPLVTPPPFDHDPDSDIGAERRHHWDDGAAAEIAAQCRPAAPGRSAGTHGGAG